MHKLLFCFVIDALVSGTERVFVTAARVLAMERFLNYLCRDTREEVHARTDVTARTSSVIPPKYCLP